MVDQYDVAEKDVKEDVKTVGEWMLGAGPTRLAQLGELSEQLGALAQGIPAPSSARTTHACWCKHARCVLRK